MNKESKLRGGGNSELTRFKELWNKPAFAPSRDYWLEQFGSTRTQAELRGEILRKLKVSLGRDKQLTEFRQWVEAQEQRELMALKIEERKKELLAGGMTLAEAQDVLLTEASAYSVAARDFKLGLRVSAEISKANVVTLDRNKFEFDAARACLAKLPQLKAISTNKELSEDERLEQARLALFGVAPK